MRKKMPVSKAWEELERLRDENSRKNWTETSDVPKIIKRIGRERRN